MTPLEILIAGRAKVASGWNRGWFAVKADGARCEPNDPDAVKFCSIGALMAVTKEFFTPTSQLESEKYMEPFMILRSALPAPYESVSKFNDRQGSAYPVLELFDRAIASVTNG